MLFLKRLLMVRCQLRSRPLNFPLEGSIVPQAIKEPSSKFMGVSWHKPAKRWTASITELGKNKHLGYYPSEEQAARSYDDHAGPLGRKVCFFFSFFLPPGASIFPRS
jgi:hypothetical protein